MPLYDCMLLLKPTVSKESIMDLVTRLGKHVYLRNGVVADIKSFGTLQLGYGIRKRDGRYFQGQLMQMSMMTPPTFRSELSYLNDEDRLLRWLLVKHRNIKFGLESFTENDIRNEMSSFGNRHQDDDEDEDDDDEDEEDEDAESDQSRA